MSTDTTHDSWFNRKLGKNRFQAIGAGVLLSGALLLGACGDDDDDDIDTPTLGTDTTVTTTVPTMDSSPANGTSPTTTGTMTTRGSGGTPAAGTPSTGGTPTTGTPGAGGVMTVFENEFEDRPWFTAVEDVEINDGEVMVTVNEQAATLTESEVEEMCNDVSEVVFSDVLDEEISMLTVEDEMGTEVATANAEGECTVA